MPKFELIFVGSIIGKWKNDLPQEGTFKSEPYIASFSLVLIVIIEAE